MIVIVIVSERSGPSFGAGQYGTMRETAPGLVLIRGMPHIRVSEAEWT